jgi:dipeptidase
MKKKLLIAMLILLIISAQSVFACIIFGVGRLASADGSTMTSHTCDSTGDDLRLWLIPSLEEGTEREVVVDGRKDADFTNFPEVKDYGARGMVVDSYVNDKDTYQYLHAMYSFANEKGVTMTESTCGTTKEQRAVFKDNLGIWDCYMLQDAALENASTAREAVVFMGEKLNEGGWYGSPECMTIGDGTDVWVFEAYGGKMWCAFRLPEDAVFVCANRCRIDFYVEDDPENYLHAPNMKEFAIENKLWDGNGEFSPCASFGAGNYSFSCIGREWRAVNNLTSAYPELANEDYALTTTPDEVFPLYIIPDKKLSVDDVHKLCSDTYEGTRYDLSKSAYAGQFGNVLQSSYEYRPTNVVQCTYFQISNVKAWLPEEARCLVWFGWGAPVTTYLTPVFASQTELADHFGKGVRAEYSEESGWWNEALVQEAATINYADAIQVIRGYRDPLMDVQYQVTSVIQNQAAKMIKNGDKEGAIELLTTYANQQAKMWFDLYGDLSTELLARYVVGRVAMKTPTTPDKAWWTEVLKAVQAVNAAQAVNTAQ